MAATPLVVSLWRRKDKQGFLCSGLLLTGRHILTVKHAFDTGTENDSVYVRLIDGVDGDIEAKVVQRHRDRDAAILELGTAVVAIGPDLLTHGGRSFDGQPATIRVVDPDNFGRATFSNYSIGRFDHETGEYILAPEDALGHSGGIVEVDDRIVALLSRRKKDGPLCRAVAMHLLWPWIEGVIGSPRTEAGGQVALRPLGKSSPAYEALVEKVRARIRDRLTHPGMEALTRSWGIDPLDGFDWSEPAGRLQDLLDGLHRATESSLDAWRRASADGIAAVKDHCRALLSELVKLSVSPMAGDTDLEGVAGSPPNRLYLACRYEGTADVIYCALWDLPHLLDRYSRENGVVSRGAVHLDDLLPSGQGEDLRQEVLKKLWVMVVDEDLPGRIDQKRYGQLVSRIRRHGRRDNKRYFVVARSPSNSTARDPYGGLAEELQLGLALHREGECDYLLMEETDLIDTAYEYLQLLERL